jgi:hypothetical protein
MSTPNWLGGTVTQPDRAGNMTVSVAINSMSEINARANATFVNNGASTLSYDSDILVSQDARGTGSFAVTQGASLVFLAAVGPGLTVFVSNTTVFGSGRLNIDNPNEFHGAVDLTYIPGAGAGMPRIDLLGLTRADSYSYHNDMLSIWSGKSVIETLRLATSTPYGFTVQLTKGGVSVIADTANHSFPGALPVHIGS